MSGLENTWDLWIWLLGAVFLGAWWGCYLALGNGLFSRKLRRCKERWEAFCAQRGLNLSSFLATALAVGLSVIVFLLAFALLNL